MVSHWTEESRSADESLPPLLQNPFTCPIPLVPIHLLTGVTMTLCKPWVGWRVFRLCRGLSGTCFLKTYHMTEMAKAS